jgi:methylmalonyl-CoA/ethylmalonyl-CoA epimerase
MNCVPRSDHPTSAVPDGFDRTIPIDHVAVAVRDTGDALRLYRDVLGLRASPTDIAPSENLKITFLTGANTRIEVLEPLPGDSAVARFLEKRGEGLHHVCFVVPDVAAQLDDFAAAGYQLVDERPRRNHHGDLVAFVHPKTTHGVMIELYQERSAAPDRAAGGVSDGVTVTREDGPDQERPSP